MRAKTDLAELENRYRPQIYPYRAYKRSYEVDYRLVSERRSIIFSP